MRSIRLLTLLAVFLWTFSSMAAGPASEAVPGPAVQPSSISSLGLEADFGGSTCSQVCDPNRECTTHAQCGQFGHCAVWRMCVCSG